jgi:hypothetical protein
MNTVNLSSASNVFLLLADVVLTILVAMILMEVRETL